MDNEIYDAVAEQTETAKNALHTVQTQAHQAGEQSFAAAKDFGDNMRAVMEKSLHETRARYVKTKSAMDEATAALQTSLGAAREGAAQLNAKAIDAIKEDAAAGFDLIASMASAKSLPDVLKLNTEYVRKRFEETTARAKSFSEFARKIADESAAPVREQLSKTFKFAS